MDYKGQKKKKFEFHDIDLLLINEKKKSIYPVGRTTRERIFEEIMDSDKNPETVFEHVRSVKSATFLPTPFGTASFHIYPKGDETSVNSLNPKTGAIGLSFYKTKVNMFGALDRLSFEFGKDALESTFILAELGIPFSFVPRASMGLTFEQQKQLLFPGINLFERMFGCAFAWRKPSNDVLSLKMGSNRYMMDPFNFRGYDTRSLREEKSSIRLGYRRLLHQSADQSLRIKGSVDGIFFEELQNDLVLGFEAAKITSMNKLRHLPNIELETKLMTSLHMAGLGRDTISMPHKHIFSNIRGFSNIESNIPFAKKENSLVNDPISSELSFSLTSRLISKDFNIFGKDTVFPMVHLSNYGTLRNFNKLSLNTSTGVGFSVRALGVDFEIMYNPLHFNLNRSKFNVKDYFQVRMNLRI